MKNLFAVICFAMIAQVAIGQATLATSAAQMLKAGNSKALAEKFTANITLSILDEEELYSRAQAELVLKSFFAKNTPNAFKIIHEGKSKNGMQYIIGNLTTKGDTFRVSYYISKVAAKNFIKELRIEENEDN